MHSDALRVNTKAAILFYLFDELLLQSQERHVLLPVQEAVVEEVARVLALLKHIPHALHF